MSAVIDAAHRSVWRTADAVFGITLIAGIGLQFVQPLSFTPSDSLMPHLIGAPLLLFGTAIVFLGKRELARHAQPSEPRAPTTQLVTSGVFKYSRNPLYTGIAIAFSGLAFATDMPWWLLLLPPVLAATHFLLILPEERYLRTRFGEEYEGYARRVRRWG